jgi:hypothetical protein
MSLRRRIAVFVVSGIAALSLATVALAHSGWTLTVADSTYSGWCNLNDSNTPQICVGTLTSGPGVDSGTRYIGGCPVTFGGLKATMVCPPKKQ